MDANSSRADDPSPEAESTLSGDPGERDFATSGDEWGETLAAYERHKRHFVEAGGTAQRFDDLKLLQAARLQANRIWGVLARIRGEDPTPASEREVRNSLGGFAIEAEAARARGRLRAFARRLWPFGLPWG
ncbi:hypothetical protein [Paludisphaera sp.]|uniref:hypothetical protein n=1 Tax=Paludisphaera sp. TaxID=2017432 RepID=UPI00301CC6F5